MYVPQEWHIYYNMQYQTGYSTAHSHNMHMQRKEEQQEDAKTKRT
jgi:hypothetical protein